MPEIRINSKPCPNCGYRNVTEESRSCERCGYSLQKVRNRRLSVGVILAVVLLLGSGGILYNLWSQNPESRDANRQPVRNEVKPQAPEKQKKEEEKRKNSSQQYVAQTANTSEEKTDATAYSSYASEANLPAQYNVLVQGAEQMAGQLNIRVWGGQMDEFENEDLATISQKLSEPAYLTKDVHIISFAGSVGTPFIAEKRAEFLKRVMKEKYNLPQNIAIYGFGPLNEDSPTGEPVIEVWVK